MPTFDDTRADWHARPPLRALTAVPLSRRTEFFTHYIGPGAPDFAHRPHADCLEQVRVWQGFHQSKGWKDIGYNALVCGHARLIEGRGLSYSGSHCPDHNTTGFGVQLMVAGDETPTPAMYARLRRLYDELCTAKGGALAMRGHRDGTATECPGDIVYGWVQARMPAPALPPRPRTKPGTPTQEVSMFMVQLDGSDPVYKSDGFRREWVSKAQRDALLGAGVKLTVVKTREALNAFGVEVKP